MRRVDSIDSEEIDLEAYCNQLMGMSFEDVEAEIATADVKVVIAALCSADSIMSDVMRAYFIRLITIDESTLKLFMEDGDKSKIDLNWPQLSKLAIARIFEYKAREKLGVVFNEYSYDKLCLDELESALHLLTTAFGYYQAVQSKYQHLSMDPQLDRVKRGLSVWRQFYNEAVSQIV